jgi:hypothetical protein
MLVCEGYAEDELGSAASRWYLPRDCGTVLRRRNVRGFGGQHALQEAIRIARDEAFDSVAVMVDNDAHWGKTERALANKHRITIVENEPCIEATLLRVAGINPPRSTRECKAVFMEVFGDEASRSGVILRKFSREKLDAARARVAAIDHLLRLIRC